MLDVVFLLVGAGFLIAVLGLRPGVRPPLRTLMDYLIAVVASALLFGYLVYALLRPERF